jgi:ABC-type nitrate/sulfonate/bicarbonate transport system substrate-binding protein
MVKARGTFEEYGLDPEWLFLSSGDKVVTALLAGQADVCRASGFGQVLAAVSKGGTLKVVGGASILITQALFAKDPAIKTLKDLEGKNVGAGAPGALLHHMTVALLKKEGVDLSKVNFVSIGSSAQVFRAVVAGIVDAGASQIDVLEEGDQFGVHAIAEFWKALPDYPYQAAYSTQKIIDEKRDVLVRCMAAFGDLYKYLQEDDKSLDDWMKAYAKATGKEAGKGAKAAWQFTRDNKPYNITMTAESVNYLQDLNIDQGIQTERIPMEKIIDFTIARDALKMIG